MSRKCQITGRGPRVGNKVSHSHKISKRRWHINLQKIRVLIDGKVRRIRVSTKAIRSGLIEKPPIRIRARKKLLRSRVAEIVETVVEEVESAIPFRTQESQVDRIFKRKPKSSAEMADDGNHIIGEEISGVKYQPGDEKIDEDIGRYYRD